MCVHGIRADLGTLEVVLLWSGSGALSNLTVRSSRVIDRQSRSGRLERREEQGWVIGVFLLGVPTASRLGDCKAGGRALRHGQEDTRLHGLVGRLEHHAGQGEELLQPG